MDIRSSILDSGLWGIESHEQSDGMEDGKLRLKTVGGSCEGPNII